MRLQVVMSVNDSKSPQVSRTLLSILAGLDNAIIWIVSILSLIFNFPCLLSDLPSAKTTIGTHRHPHIPKFFRSQARFKHLSTFLFFYFDFHSMIILLIIDFPGQLMSLKVFHLSLSDRKSLQVFLTLLSILVDLSNALV